MLWFKVNADFDTENRLSQVEGLRGGIYYAYIYIKLQALATLSNQAGGIYIADGIPHNAKTLANKWHFRKSVVENALKALCEVKLIEIIDDTIFIADWEQVQNAEKLDKIRENNRLRKQKSRAKRAELQMEMSHLGHKMSHLGHTTDIDKEKEKEIDGDGDKEKKVQTVVDLFNTTATTLPKIKILSDRQKEAVIKAVDSFGVDNIAACFSIAAKSRFLNGDNKQGWKASFDWLIQCDNIPKVLNGNYDEVFSDPSQDSAGTLPSSFDTDEFVQAALARGFLF